MCLPSAQHILVVHEMFDESSVNRPPPSLDFPQIKSTFKDSPAPVSQKDIQ